MCIGDYPISFLPSNPNKVYMDQQLRYLVRRFGLLDLRYSKSGTSLIARQASESRSIW